MNRQDRIFDVVDPVVKRPGMYVKEPFLPGIFDVIYHFDYALLIADSLDKRDRGEEPEFLSSSEPMQELIAFILKELQIEVGKYDIGQELLKRAGGDQDKAMDNFRDLYIRFRGEDYCRYMPGGKLSGKNA